MNINTAPLRFAVFDCDGTLVDSLGSITHSMQVACAHHGFAKPNADDVRRVVGLPLHVAIAKVLTKEDISESYAHEISKTYKTAFFDLRQGGGVNEPMYDGIHAVLDRLDAENWLLGIATGKSLRGLTRTLEHHGLLDRFLTHQTADSALGKPNPDMMIKAMGAVGAEPEFTVMIGDTTYDIEMAVNAGTQAIGVAWGYHETDELMDAGAACIVHTADELISALIGGSS
ncbi:MAG: haloacid dehalogenase [Rhodospirillaceae bacterium]|nr:MAG: haloacid dehalogenase [Rhodospirillaceae bacterium]